jgi:hypothetical protein
MKDKGPGPLLFKPPPKWQVLSALGGALLVHGIAVALAFHKEPPPVDTSDIPTATIEATLGNTPRERELHRHTVSLIGVDNNLMQAHDQAPSS